MFLNNTSGHCFLCGSAAQWEQNPPLDFTVFNCCQCGQFKLSNSLIATCERTENVLLRQRFAALVAEWNLRNMPRLILTDEMDSEKIINNGMAIMLSYNKLLSLYPKDKQELYERALYNLSMILGRRMPYSTIHFDKYNPLAVFFASGLSLDDIAKNIMRAVTDMQEMGLLSYRLLRVKYSTDFAGVMDAYLGVNISDKGWESLATQKKGIGKDSLQAFVAMCPDPTRNIFYDKGIRPAIEAAHYPEYEVRAMRVGFGPFNDMASEEIMKEVRRSQYLVADVSGNHPGVYQEAGYAQAMGIPVIWAIDRNSIIPGQWNNNGKTGIVRHYRYIVYESAEDLQEQLKSRIASTISIRCIRENDHGKMELCAHV